MCVVINGELIGRYVWSPAVMHDRYHNELGTRPYGRESWARALHKVHKTLLTRELVSDSKLGL